MKDRDVNRNLVIIKEPLFEVRDSPFTIALRESASARSVYSLLIALHIIYAAYVHLLWKHFPDVYQADVSSIKRVVSSLHICLLLEIALVASVTTCTLLTFRWRCFPAFLVQSHAIIGLPLAVVRYGYVPELVAGFVMMEQVRFIFKSISLVVEVKHCGHQPTIKSIVYFLFAPTLVYQPEYPKSNSRDWSKILIWSIETTCMAVTFMLLISQMLVPAFRDEGKVEVTGTRWLEQLRASLVIGAYQMLVVGYTMLHIQQNWYAEVLCFGDRRFYRDWMSSMHPIDFARRWNLIVHTWILRYVYGPMMAKTGSRIFSLLSVFMISFMSHDYVLNVAGNIFFPYFTMSIIQLVLATPVILLLVKAVNRFPIIASLLSRNNVPFLTMQLIASAWAVYSYSCHYYRTINAQ